MPKSKTVNECYDLCLTKGFFENVSEINIKKIETNLIIAQEDLASAQDALKNKRWNSGYKLFYDVLHILVEAYLCFDKIKSLNHQCLFAYLCTKHPQLEFDWNFFEKIRTKRNGINYYGQAVNQEDWKSVELQFNVYISTLKKEIRKKLNK